MSPRVSPFAELRDPARPAAARRLRLAGGRPRHHHRDLSRRLHAGDRLRVMGESNAVTAPDASRRETLLRRPRHQAAPPRRGRSGHQVLYLTGWAPHASQQQPLAPAAPRAAALDAEERPPATPRTTRSPRSRGPKSFPDASGRAFNRSWPCPARLVASLKPEEGRKDPYLADGRGKLRLPARPPGRRCCGSAGCRCCCSSG